MTEIVKDVEGVYWLEITPDPTVELWYVKTAGGETRTFTPKDNRVKLGKNLVEPVQATLTPADVVRRAAQTFVYPAVTPPPPPPPPPPGAEGAKLLAMFPRASVGTGKVTSGDLTSRWTPKDNELLRNFAAAGWLGPDAHAIYVNGADNVAIEDGWVHDMEVGPNRPQVAQIAGGSTNVQIRRVRSDDIGYSKLDHAYYVSQAEAVLIASCLISDSFEYPIHAYGPGPVKDVIIANCTIYGSAYNQALAVLQTDIDNLGFVNCAFLGDETPEKWIIRNKQGVNLWAQDCVWFGAGAFESHENPQGDVKQTRVLKADPRFRNPNAMDFTPEAGSPLIGNGDESWQPYLDVYGKPFTRPTIGCVAA